MKKKKGNHVIKYIVFIAIFAVILSVSIGIAVSKKQTEQKNYRQMKSASLPIVSLTYNDEYETQLHGYTNEMTISAMRDCIVPLSKDKSIKVVLTPFNNTILKLDYALRSLDGKQYIDGGSVQNFVNQSNTLSCTLTFSDLMVSGTEYQLVLTLQTRTQDVYYYARVLYSKTEYSDELLQFAKKFSESTYDAEKADFIVNYIQPYEDSATNNFYYADLHSKYAMLTYSGLKVERKSGMQVRITELEPTQLSVTLSYMIMINLDGAWKNFLVEEFFCVRYRSQKVYLLDYHRTLEQEFVAEDALKEKGRVLLGVGDGAYEVMNSKNSNYTAFVINRELWSYNTKTNSISLIFSFNDDSDTSTRSSYNHHDVQVVKISDNGDIDYMVYGYMNRGSNEGQVGICFYRFSAENNATTRLFFMPVSESEHLLITDMGTLAYVNEEDVCYLRYGDGIYSIDLNSGESVEVSIRAYPGAYAMNDIGNVVAWQEGDDLSYPERLVVLNMDSQTTAVVNAEEGEFVKILDFIGDDVIYGFGKKSDSIIEANVDMQQLLYDVFIASTDDGLKIQQEYAAKDFFIMNANAEDTRVVISRVKKNNTGAVIALDDAVILLTQSIAKDATKSSVQSRTDDVIKREYYIQMSTNPNTDPQYAPSLPRFEETSKINTINLLFEQSNAYYVYGYGTLLYVESDINKAINEAYDSYGVVVDSSLNFLWTRGTRDLYKTISIQPYSTKESEETLAVSLRILCAQEGIQLSNVNHQLENGTDPFTIINQAIGENRAVNLYSCSLSEVLYFVNEAHPVLAITGNRSAVLIIGYDTETITVYYPLLGTTEKVKMNEATKFFEKYGNAFISYL